MDSKTKNVLISIHPKYVDLISAGKKKIEFRKRSFSRPIKRILVYSTAPVSKVVGFFDVENIEISTPGKLWKDYSDIGGIGRVDFFNYYANATNAVGIHIKKYTSFNQALSISLLNTTPPQSYKYLTDKEFDFVQKKGIK